MVNWCDNKIMGTANNQLTSTLKSRQELPLCGALAASSAPNVSFYQQAKPLRYRPLVLVTVNRLPIVYLDILLAAGAAAEHNGKIKEHVSILSIAIMTENMKLIHAAFMENIWSNAQNQLLVSSVETRSIIAPG